MEFVLKLKYLLLFVFAIKFVWNVHPCHYLSNLRMPEFNIAREFDWSKY
jgi:hypothetical protein